MAIISKEGLLKVLVSYNPWWKTGVVNPKLSKTCLLYTSRCV